MHKCVAQRGRLIKETVICKLFVLSNSPIGKRLTMDCQAQPPATLPGQRHLRGEFLHLYAANDNAQGHFDQILDLGDADQLHHRYDQYLISTNGSLEDVQNKRRMKYVPPSNQSVSSSQDLSSCH